MCYFEVRLKNHWYFYHYMSISEMPNPNIYHQVVESITAEICALTKKVSAL